MSDQYKDLVRLTHILDAVNSIQDFLRMMILQYFQRVICYNLPLYASLKLLEKPQHLFLMKQKAYLQIFLGIKLKVYVIYLSMSILE